MVKLLKKIRLVFLKKPSYLCENPKTMTSPYKKPQYSPEIKTSEDAIQAECFLWAWHAYTELRMQFFAVPNGGLRTGREANKLRSMGSVAGVSDLIFFRNGKTLFVEIKTEKGTQSAQQREFMCVARKNGFEYVIVRNLPEFKRIFCEFFGVEEK